MRKVCATGFNRSQIVLLRMLLKLLIGTATIVRCRDAAAAVEQNCDLVVLNCALSEAYAEKEFSVLENAGCNILVLSEYILHPLFAARCREYTKSVLLIYPQDDAELTDCAQAIKNGKRYISIAARSSVRITADSCLPRIDELSAVYRKALFAIARGDTTKEVAADLAIKEHSVENIRCKLRKAFGNCVSDTDIIEKLTWIF